MEWIFTIENLINSPSRADGIKQQLELEYRAKTCWFLEELGKQLFQFVKETGDASYDASRKLHNRLVVSTAQVLFHRFFALQSFSKHDRFIVAVAAMFLACKAEESFLFRLNHIVRVYVSVRRTFQNPARRVVSEEEMKDIENSVLFAERIMLHTLCFDLQITHPYTFCYEKARAMKNFVAEEQRSDFYQVATNFINDSFRTSLCLLYHPHQIALCCIFLATLHMGLTPVNINRRNTTERTWFELLQPQEFDLPKLDKGIDEQTLLAFCNHMLDFYGNMSVMSRFLPSDAQSIQARLPRMQANFQAPDEEEVDLDAPYPYEDNENDEPMRANISSSMDSVRTAPASKKPRVTLVFANSTPVPVPAVSSMVVEDSNTNLSSASAYNSTPIGEISTLSNSSNPSPIEPAPAVGDQYYHPYLRGRSLSEDSTTQLGQMSEYSAASPPPPPPPSDTPASSVCMSEHQYAFSDAGDISPPPPPPPDSPFEFGNQHQPPTSEHFPFDGYSIDVESGKTSPKRQRME